jgi:hypothetical protein
MTERTNEDEYHNRVMALTTRINDTISADTSEFSVRVNALLTLLALAGMQSDLSKDQFQAAISWQLSEIMSRMTVSEHPVQ